jgi:mRNA-degrading endonuclease toxin of MazEF toxin-antitoxin module
VKDFNNWNRVKKNIDHGNRLKVKVGEGFWCYLGLNIGTEQNGDEKYFRRPVIILKKYSGKTVLIAPLTTKLHSGSWYLNVKFNNILQQVVLNQIKPIDTKRLIKSMGQISDKEVDRIIISFFELISK